MYSKLQYISQGVNAEMQLDNIRQALEAGCKWIQLRFKNAGDEEVKKLAAEVRKLCQKYDATFILNDHAHIAHAIDADGVHLGQMDMPISEARGILGADKIIGGTANTLNDILKHVEAGCNYIGLGPFRFTMTKEKLSPILGIAGYAEIMTALRQQYISIPVYAIGGIVPEDIHRIMEAGVYGIAVSGMITNNADKNLLVEQINASLYEATNYSR